MEVDLQVASSLPVAMASPLGWNLTLLISEVWPWGDMVLWWGMKWYSWYGMV